MSELPRRLIEVDLPIREISAHARREKSIRRGHISTLHIWWARRPLAACRAVILAALWPDPADPLCPEGFRTEAAKAMKDFRNHRGGTHREWSDPVQVRAALLDFIAEFANWDNSTNTAYLEPARHLVQVAHETLGGAPGTRPLVIDPFAGGGSIPLEALRVGADAVGSDLNPIPVLLNRVLLEYIPKHRDRLAQEFRKAANWVKEQVTGELIELYPPDDDGSVPIAFLWARTINCEGPGCGVEVPLLRSTALSKRAPVAHVRVQASGDSVTLRLEEGAEESSSATIRAGKATCPRCGYTTPAKRVKAQTSLYRGGADSSRLFAVLVEGSGGRRFREPNDNDLVAIGKARERIRRVDEETPGALPDAEISPLRPYKNTVGVCIVTRLGISRFRDLYTARQLCSILSFEDTISRVPTEALRDFDGLSDAVMTVLYLTLDRIVNANSSLSRWNVAGSKIEGLFSKQALQVVWDYAESNPIGPAMANWVGAVEWVARVLEANSFLEHGGTAALVDARRCPLPDDSCDLFFTDPPYFAAIPYADLSDVFYTWLRRNLRPLHPELFVSNVTEKASELIVTNAARGPAGEPKDASYFTAGMSEALASARRVSKPDALGCVVFADSSTASWESILKAVIDGGWIITASWPIDTELQNRTRASSSASLQSSIFMVCRPRENPDGALRQNDIGDWRAVLRELPVRIHEWMPRLAKEGVVGADAIFACLGPALEIFSRYARVEKASGDRVDLLEFLEQVWAAVAKEAFSLIFSDGDAIDLEPDARLTAIWFWALHVERNGSKGAHAIVDPEASVDDEAPDGINEDNRVTPKNARKPRGYTMEFDTARKLAQGLGVHLETLAGPKGILEIKGSLAAIRPVSDRSSSLLGAQGSLFEFGNRGAKWRSRKQGMGSEKVKMKAAAEREEPLFDVQREPVMPVEQRILPGFFPPDTRTVVERLVDGGHTTLDRLHQAMLLFGRGQTGLIGPMLVATGMASQPAFWKLAQSLSALYPNGTDEKRWVDGVLARKKGLGFG